MDPKLKAFLAVLACVWALMCWKLIVGWDKMRDEARREKHKKKYRGKFGNPDDDQYPPMGPL